LKRLAQVVVLVALILLPVSVQGVGIIFLGILPTATAIGVIGISGRSIARSLGVTQVLLGIVALSLSLLSLWVLKRMFIDRAGATYFPYIAIALTIPIAAIQAYLADGHDKAA
jgi:hypothetical protein